MGQLLLDPDFHEAEYHYIQRLQRMPDWYTRIDEITQRSEDRLAKSPDNPWVIQNMARWLRKQGPMTSEQFYRQETLYRKAVSLRPVDSHMPAELGLHFWLKWLGLEALAVMRRWQRSNPGVVDPLTPLVEANLTPDPEKAIRAAELILANKWGGPINVVPFYSLANDYVKVIDMVALPHDKHPQRTYCAGEETSCCLPVQRRFTSSRALA